MIYNGSTSNNWLTTHDSLYFVIVTLITVGYGDINPTYTQGEVVTLLMLLITLILVPTQTTELLRLIKIKSIYTVNDYKSGESPFVIVTGYIGINAIQNFCEELFHPEHSSGNLQYNAVLI